MGLCLLGCQIKVCGVNGNYLSDTPKLKKAWPDNAEVL